MKQSKRLARGAMLTLAALALLPVSLAAAYPRMADDIPITTDSEAARMDFIAGQAAMDGGDAVQANTLFRAAVDKDPDFAYAWLNIGNTAISGQEFVTATRRASELAEKASEGERMMIAINMRFMDNDFEKQISIARQLVEKFPKSARAWLTLAGAENNIQDYAAARKSAKKAIEVDPEFVPGYVTLANSYLFNEPKDFAKAKTYFKEVLAMEPAQDNHYWGLGDVYRAMGNLDAARDYYTRSAMLDPGNGTAFTKRAHVNSFLGNYEEAREDYRHAAKVALPGARTFLANYMYFTHVYEGHPEKAVAGLKELYGTVDDLELDEKQRDGAKIFTLTNAATICMHKGMDSEAENLLAMRANSLRETAKIVGTKEFANIQEANIAYFSGLAAARRGDIRSAKKYAKENAELVKSQENPLKMQQYHDLMGLITLKEGKFKQAVEHYRQANLNNIYTKYHLGLALEGAKQQEEAKAVFKDVANWNFNSVGYALIRQEAMKKII